MSAEGGGGGWEEGGGGERERTVTGGGEGEKMEKEEEEEAAHLRHRPLWGSQTPGLVESENSTAGEELRLLKSTSLYKDCDKIAVCMVKGSYY